jgi:hypothetical protein
VCGADAVERVSGVDAAGQGGCGGRGAERREEAAARQADGSVHGSQVGAAGRAISTSYGTSAAQRVHVP